MTNRSEQSPRLRLLLATAIANRVKAWNVPQAEAARRLGFSQPRLNLILNHASRSGTVDSLVDVALRLGLDVKMAVGEQSEALIAPPPPTYPPTLDQIRLAGFDVKRAPGGWRVVNAQGDPLTSASSKAEAVAAAAVIVMRGRDPAMEAAA